MAPRPDPKSGKLKGVGIFQMPSQRRQEFREFGLRENLLRLRHIHQYEPFVHKIEVTSGHPGSPGIALNDLDISKPMLSNEFSCQRDEP